MDYAQTILLGRLTAAPMFSEGKKEDKSDDRCWAKVAVNRRRTKKDKEAGKPAQADFHCICAWGVYARILAEYGHKGKTVMIVGRPQTHTTQRLDGTYDNYTEVVVNNIVLGGHAAKNMAPSIEEETDKSTVTQLSKENLSELLRNIKINGM